MKKRIVELESLRGIMCIIIAFFMHYNWLMTSDYPVKSELPEKFLTRN